MKFFFSLICISFLISAGAQVMQVKVPNYTVFRDTERNVSSSLVGNSSPDAQQHPEFGLLPFNAQCRNCVELIDKRTIDSRLFIDPQNTKHSYSQKSIFPLHYKASENDVWHTIDPRLQPVGGEPGVYSAPHQPVPTSCNMNKKCVTLTAEGLSFEYNRNLNLSFFNAQTYTQAQPVNYGQYTIGEDGLLVKDAWPGIDMEQIFAIGEVRTDFVIKAPLSIPLNDGYMVIEDKFTLPTGYTFAEGEGSHLENGGFTGNYEIKDAKGKSIIIYEKPVFYDSRVLGSFGIYHLQNFGNNYTLQLLVPISWLKQTDLVYPLVIDPVVYGLTRYGDYLYTGQTGANLGFTSMALGSCDYHMNVLTPGPSQLVDAYVGLEYTLTYNPSCGNPPLIAPFCTFSQVSMEVLCDSCQTSTGILACDPASPPYTGTCGTDSNLVPGSTLIHVNNINPNFLSCYSGASCGESIAFTLKNRDSICGDVCGNLCARGNMWLITLETMATGSPSIISVNGDSLISSIPSGNQWYLNGIIVPGATGVVYEATTPGWYTVVNSSVSPCLSEPYYFDTACKAMFNIVDGSAFGYDSIYFGYNQSLGYNLNYLWDFGDSTTSTDQYPDHLYAQPGHYLVCLTVSNAHCTNMFCDSSFYVFKTDGGLMSELHIINPTGLNDETNQERLRIYPNPAWNELIIESPVFKPDDIAVFDLNGRQILKEHFSNHIDISHLTPGLYVLILSNPKGQVVKRFAKM
ncbi:MAG: PKD domain-containing protein [Chitinophagales bacterium]